VHVPPQNLSKVCTSLADFKNDLETQFALTNLHPQALFA